MSEFQQAPPLPAFIVRLRAASAIGLAGFTACLGLAATVIGAWTGTGMAIFAVPSVLLALTATVAAVLAPQALATRTTLAACLAGGLMLLIGAASSLGDGAVQQAHMLYFVTNTLLLGLVCPTAMITYNVVVVLHHVVLTWAAPRLVWHTSDPATDLANLAVHASIAVVLVGPLLLLSRQIMRSAVTSEAALENARAAATAADTALVRQTLAENEGAEARRLVLRDVRTRLGGTLDDIIGSVNNVAGTVCDGAAELAGSSHALDQSAAAMIAKTDEASRSMVLVAAAVEQLAASVHEVQTQMQAAADSSHRAADQAQAVEATVAGLDSSAREIEAVIGLISSIASRTSLLALNATIESARAGEAGKGFAVVASEVKQLANQTAHATETISQQIAAMAARTKAAVTAIRSILEAVSTADQRAGAAAGATQHQQAATDQITQSVNVLAAGAQANSAELHQVQRDIASVEQQGESLRHAAERLAVSVDAARRDADLLLNSLAA